MSHDDWILISSIKAGDQGAFNQLVNKYKARAVNVAYAYLHDLHDAQEIAQDAFVRVYKAADKFNEQSSFYTWFYRILINLCIDFRRKKRMKYMLFSQFRSRDAGENEQAFENSIADPTGNDPVKLILDKELNSQLRTAIDSLPEKQKKAFVLKHYAALPIKEVASTMGAAEGTVKSHLARAAKTLEIKLSDYMTEVSL